MYLSTVRSFIQWTSLEKETSVSTALEHLTYFWIVCMCFQKAFLVKRIAAYMKQVCLILCRNATPVFSRYTGVRNLAAFKI
jgi:hypothetical protein